MELVLFQKMVQLVGETYVRLVFILQLLVMIQQIPPNNLLKSVVKLQINKSYLAGITLLNFCLLVTDGLYGIREAIVGKEITSQMERWRGVHSILQCEYIINYG